VQELNVHSGICLKDYKFSSPVETHFSLMIFIANNKEILQIQQYVASVRGTDTIFTRKLPTSEAVTKVYIMVA
jgi:hypothetical protein